MYFDEEQSSWASLAKLNLDNIGINFTKSQEIETINLDSWLDSHQVTHMDVVKIDVERLEYEVLMGAVSNIENIKLIQFEFGGTNIDSRTYFKDYCHFSTKISFQFFELPRRDLFKLVSIRKNLSNFPIQTTLR